MKISPKISLAAAVWVFGYCCFVQNSAAQSSPELYRVLIIADGVTTNDFGRLAGVFAGNREIIRQCASDNGITDLNSLTLVYDRNADALEVVDRRDGTVICSPFIFSGGVSVPNASGSFRERLAFVYLNDNEEAAGTIRGTESYRYNSNGDVVRFNFTGKLQFGIATEGKRTKIYTAFFFTGPRFVPRG